MDRLPDDTFDESLRSWRDGDATALDRLLPLVYDDLRQIAGNILRITPGHATLQATALTNEVLLSLLGREPSSFDSESHLLNACARMMRQVLVDRARRAATTKHGGRWQRDEFTELLNLPIPDGTELATLDEALCELEVAHPRMAQAVQLRYFMGLEVREMAAVLHVNERTVQRDWLAARLWLREWMDATEPRAAGSFQ